MTTTTKKGYFHPGKEVIDLLLDGNVESLEAYAKKHNLECYKYPANAGGDKCRIAATGWVMDSINPDSPSVGSVLYIRPVGYPPEMGFDYWLRYSKSCKRLESQDENGEPILIPFTK